MKNLNKLLVFFLLAIVPLGSWYYLRTGLDYRKNALEELRPKYYLTEKCQGLTYPKGFTTVLLNTENAPAGKEQLNEFEQVLRKEFDDVPKLNISSFDLLKNDTAQANGFDVCNPINLKAITLIDTSGQVRKEYDGSKDSFRKVIEHMAVVLPRQEEKDISQKNYK